MRTRAAWGLDIGSSTLKLARVEDAGGRLTLHTYGPVALPADPGTSSPEALAQGIELLLSSAGAKRAALSAALPRSLATIKFPRLPRTTPQQAAQMVRFEAQRYVPFAVEDVLLSFQELPEHGHIEVTAEGTADQMELVLAAVRRDIVAEYRGAIAAAGGGLAHLSISTMGLWNALHHAPVPAEPDEAIVVMDIGGRSSAVTVFDKGDMIFNRSAAVGGEGLTAALMAGGEDRVTAEARKREAGVEAMAAAPVSGPLLREASPVEDWAESLAGEARRSLAAARGERRGLQMERLFLTGGGAKTPGLAAYLESAIGMPTQPLELPGLVSDPQFAEAVGIALGGLDRGVAILDLVPEEIERERRQRLEHARMRLAALAGLVLLAGATVFGIKSFETQRQNAQRIQQAQLLVDRADTRLKAAEKDYEQVSQQAAMLQTALRPDHTWLDVMQDVSDRAPAGVWLTGFDLEKGKPMALRGTGLTQGSVQAFWSNLSRSPLLVRPNLSYSNQAKVAEKSVFQFGITSDVVGNRDKPAKPTKKRARPTTRSSSADTSASGTSGDSTTGG